MSEKQAGMKTVTDYKVKTTADYEEEALALRFAAHVPTKGNFTPLGKLALFFSTELLKVCPDCRERQEAVKKLEECVLWAQLGIDRNPPKVGQ